MHRMYRDYFLCERSLLFVPEWFAPPQADAWPRGLSQVGWPLEDDEPNPEPNPEPTAPSIPDALARWLEETAPKLVAAEAKLEDSDREEPAGMQGIVASDWEVLVADGAPRRATTPSGWERGSIGPRGVNDG